ncbi:hypothetical protein ACHAWU_008411 [Discostella pseudostelligera]|jgi:hypothetical protein|uniref:Uncharacterized protein n=1 Tax=Discostella pseudostelligera TaxID=259834 RepID=A0ABD3LZQ5_9STRA
MNLIQQNGHRHHRYNHGIHCVLIFIHITKYASAFLASPCQIHEVVKPIARSLWASQSINNDDNATDDDDNATDDDDYDDDDDDVPTVKPYRNRSLAWTLRYRKLNPYEKARARVISFGHRSKEDWDEAASSGQLGQYVPTYPDEMYAPEWVGWDEWLGLMRSYNDTQQLAASILGLKSLEEYYFFVKSDSKRAEGLRIPLRPDLYYEDEWIDEKSFFRRS